MSRTKEQWIALAQKRILSILKTYRVSYTRHLEIKISEAGPPTQRVEPALLSQAFRALKKEGKIKIIQSHPFEIVGAPDYGKPGDHSKLGKMNRLHELFLDCSGRSELCGYQLEHLLYQTVLNHCDDQFIVFGSGPIYQDGVLVKPPNSEINFYRGRQAYGGAGLDLFALHRDTLIPVGIEAKNIREWIYPASLEVWRMIARACTLECLPVMAARKISYITKAGFFSHFGILGFEAHFQYFNPAVKAYSKYKFNDIVKTDGLGFADIKVTDEVPKHFKHFFNDILPENLEEYYDRFMTHRDLLMKYAIDYGMAEDNLTRSRRMQLYHDFKEEANFEDPDFA